MHHKRKRPKHQRAGCLMCKPQKDERVSNSFYSLPVPAQRQLQVSIEKALLEYSADNDWYNEYEGDGMEFERFRYRKAS